MEFSTACWRGYIATYAIYRDNLILKKLYTNNGNELKNEPPLINNKLPEISVPKGLVDEYKNSYKEFKYNNINLVIPYTGSILITKDFIWNRYVHMGFQSPFSYNFLTQLTFKDGKLIADKDLSEIAKVIREKELKIPEENDDENYVSNMLNWINDCFDISFDKKAKELMDNNE
jgi:hypothetical protein